MMPTFRRKPGESLRREISGTAALRAAAPWNGEALPLRIDAPFLPHALQLGEPRSGSRGRDLSCKLFSVLPPPLLFRRAGSPAPRQASCLPLVQTAGLAS